MEGEPKPTYNILSERKPPLNMRVEETTWREQNKRDKKEWRWSSSCHRWQTVVLHNIRTVVLHNIRKVVLHNDPWVPDGPSEPIARLGHGLIIAHVTRGVIYAYQGVHCTYGSLGTKVKIQKGLWSPVFHWVRSKPQKGGEGGRSRSSKLKTITLKPTRHWAQTQANRLTC